MATAQKFRKIVLTQLDIDFIWTQLRLPGNDPRNAPLGTILDPLGIRDVQGIGNNVTNPTFGAADQLFPRLTPQSWRNADGTFTFGQTGIKIVNQPTSYAVRDVNLVDYSARVISNKVASQSAQSLSAIGYTTPAEQKLVVQDDPSATPGGRLSPLTGAANPLPYSSMMTLFGQFFDHGLDFVKKGKDGTILIPLLPDDPLYNDPRNAIYAPDGTTIIGYNNFIIASRTDTVHVDISISSTDSLVAALGLVQDRYTVGEPGVTKGQVTGATPIGSGIADGGVLIINNTAITVAQGARAADVVSAINAVAQTTGVSAAIDASNRLVLTYAAGESRNTISPFIDLSQSYGSVASHTAFVREYAWFDNDGAGSGTAVTYFMTGRLVSGGVDKGVGDGAADGMATWFDIKHNAGIVGVTLHDKDVLDIPEVRLGAEGVPFLDATGMWLVARHQVTGQVFYVKDSLIGANTISQVLRLNSDGTTSALTNTEFSSVLSNLLLQTTGHAFLDDMAHGVLRSMDPATGDVTNQQAKLLLDSHYISGDGRTNENIGLTAIHEIFHSEHNLVLADLQAGMTYNGNGTWTEKSTGRIWSGDDLFQAAKLVTEMEYQHMVFGEFARKLSPNINAFAAYDITIDPGIDAEFAHAVYRFGHSMLTETVAMTGVDPVTGLSTGVDKSVGLIQAFLNPTAFGTNTAAEIAIGMSNQVGNAIDEWVTDALRNNLVGLPLDLATLNIVRGRDTGIGSLNQVRADLYAQTLLPSLKPYVSWDDFGASLLHPESLENFIMAYARDTILSEYGDTNLSSPETIEKASLAFWNTLQGGNATQRQQYADALRAAARTAINDPKFMNGSTGLNDIDFWLGGLAEKKVDGGMLGSTFDFIFARQILSLQNADRLYYLSRLAGTDLLGEIESQTFTDIIQRNTGASHLYIDIFSVPDASIEIKTPDTFDGPTFSTVTAFNNNRINVVDALGATQRVSQAGWVGSDANGWTFYGNPGDYLDARGVFSPNNTNSLKGNASEMIGGTNNAERINGLGGNDAIWADGGSDTVEGGDGNDFIRGGDGDDFLADKQGDDFLWGDAGNDVIQAGAGIDQVFGGEGNDQLYGGLGDDAINGEGGNDVIFGDNGSIERQLVNGVWIQVMDRDGGADVILAGLGNDIIYGGGGIDIIDGGEGDDVIAGGLGGDLMTGGFGKDVFLMDASDIGFLNTLDGGMDHDIADYSASAGTGVGTGTNRQGITIDLNPIIPIIAPIGAPPLPDFFLSVEEVIGSNYNDKIRGGGSVPLNLGLITDQFAGPVNFGTATFPLVRTYTVKIDGGLGNDTIEGGDGTGQWLRMADGSYAYVGWALDANGITYTYVDPSGSRPWDPTVEGPGMDVLLGGLGIDTVSYASAASTAQPVPGAVVGPTPNLTGITINLGITSAQDTVNAGWDMVVGFENVIGSAFADTITGDAGANVLDGGAGNDTIDAGAGDDTLIGGLGDDSLQGGAGVNTVSYAGTNSTASVGATPGLTGVSVNLSTAVAQNTVNAGLDTLVNIQNAIGSQFNDTFSGGADTVTVNNLLDGGDGADSLRGGGGNDTLIGGLGTDTIDGGAGSDTVSYAGTTGAVAVNLSAAAISTVLGLVAANRSAGAAGVDVLSTLENVIGGAGNDTIAGSTAANLLDGGVGDDSIDGGAGNDTVIGGLGNDTLLGGTGNDLLQGGFGNDRLRDGSGQNTLAGGAGNDLYVVGADNATNRDLVEELADEGLDTVELTAAVTSYTLTANVENLTYTGTANSTGTGFTGNALANLIRGGAGNEFLSGAAGNDTLEGGAGNDTLDGGADIDTASYSSNTLAVTVDLGAGTATSSTAPGGSGTDVLQSIENVIGGSGNDLLRGSAADNTIDGGIGVDTMIGGLGNDTYVVDDLADVITEQAGEGIDTVITSLATYTLAANVENVRLIAGGVPQVGIAAAAASSMTVTGNALDNFIVGSTANDILMGMDGNDTIDGGEGADTMVGGKGDDVYIVDNAADVITELAGEGNDTVRTSLSTFSLANNLENLTYIGPIGFYGVGNAGNNIITGAAGNDTLVGGFGDDVLIGGDGSDTASYADATGSVTIDLTLQIVYGYYGNDTLISIERIIAGKGDDRLIGTAGNDTLDGGVGADTMIGGLGDDTYIFDDSGDIVVEGLNAGIDTILTNSGYIVLSADLDNIENVKYTGLLSFEAHGNAFANRIEGGSQNDKIYGEYGNDTLVGGAGNDSLFGGVGNDYLVDGLGLNQLAGGEDNDTYRIDIAAADQILELAGQGIDTVETTLLNYTLGSNVENLRYVGVAGLIGFNGTGNELDNLIEGGDGADNLYGLAGNDTLIGGIGNDALDGGDGRDAASYATASAAVTANLATGTNSLSDGGGTDTFYSIEDLIGSAFADSLTGDGGDNVIEGGGGNDTLSGGAGTDTASYLSAASRVTVSLANIFAQNTQGAGTDRLSNFENLTGSNFSDSLTGSTGANVIDGGFGNDALDGGSGNDTLLGGAGNDTLVGGAGDDRLDGGFGLDTASYSATTTALTIDLRTGLASGGAGNDALVNIENVLSGSGNDTLVSGSGDNLLNGGAGTDTVSYEGTTAGVTVSLAVGTATGGAGRDTLISIENVIGGDGSDTIVGSTAANVLNGGAGSDLVDGGDGNDTLIGGAGNDSLQGGAGTDTVSYAAATAAVTVNLGTSSGGNAVIGGEGADSLSGIENVIGSAFADAITGDTAANVLSGGDGNDTLDGGAGDDTLIGGTGTDSLQGGAGTDTVSYAAATAAVTVNLATSSGGNALIGGEGVDNLSGIENVIGSGAADQITGDASANQLDGGTGNDTLSGGAGDDTLIGGAGNDSLVGGTGIDTASYAASTTAVTVNLQTGNASGGAGTDTLAEIENVIGGSGNDTFTGRSAVNNTFWGGAGNDTYVIQDLGDVVVENANEGTDTVSVSGIASYTLTANVENLTNTGTTAFSGIGTSANNTMTGGTGADTLSGLAGNDSISGGDGADSLSGGDGDDTIIGGVGNDTLLGGLGNDTVSYAGTATAVTVNLAAGTATGGAGIDTLSGFENVLGSSGADTLIGSSGDNTITGGTGADTMSGGAGNDTYYVDNAGDAIVENAGEGIDTVYTSSTTYTIGANIENLILTSGTLNGQLTQALTGIGNSLDNYISGGAGADSLDGGAGNDTLVSGGAVLILGIGAADTLNGGAGTDTASFLLDAAAVSVTLANQASVQNTGNSNVRLISIENLTGSLFDDSLSGDLNANVIDGADGNDTIVGGDGNDTLIGGAGIDTVSYAANAVAVTVNLTTGVAGGAGTDTLLGLENITGSSFNDNLTGGAGANLISAGAGDDILNETTGNDTLDGGAGSDTAAFSGRMAEYSFIQDPGTGNIIVRGGTRTVVEPNNPARDIYSIYSMLVGIETVYFAAENLSVAIGQLPLSDVTPPTVLSFTSTAANGYYKQAGTIEIVATLSEAVRAGSSLRVMLDSKADPSLDSSWVVLQTAVVGNTLRGTYTVEAGDFSEDLTVIAYDGTNVNDVNGNIRMVATALPPINIADGSAIVVDTEKPDVIGFGSTSANGSYGLGDVITITARMSEIVRIGSSITVTLNNATQSTVTLSTPVDGTSLRGLYTIKAGDDVTQLAVAAYTIGAVDLAGNTNTVLDPVPPFDPAKLINLDTTPPASPVVTAVEMLPSAGAVSGPSVTASNVATSGPIYTNDRKPIVHIEAEANAAVYVYNGTRYLGQAVAVDPGSTHYTFKPQFSLAQGTYNFSAKAMDEAGNIGNPSPLDAMVMILDFTPPPKPTVDSQITSNVSPILTGSVLLTAGDVITVSVANNGSWSATLGSDGVTLTGDVGPTQLSIDLDAKTWRLDALSGLADGTYPVQVSVTDRAGNVSIDATTNELVINNVAPVLKSFGTTTPSSAYTVGMPIDIIATFGEPLKAGSQLLVELNVADSGGYKWILLETPFLDQPSSTLVGTYIVGAGETSVDPSNPTQSAPIRVTGYLLQDYNDIILTQPAANLAGVIMASVDVNDPAQVNNFTGLIGTNILIDTTAPLPPAITLITDALDPNTGAVLNYTNDSRPSFSITADPGSLVRFYAQLVGSSSPIPLGTAIEDPLTPGSFSFSPLNPITNGSYQFFVTASDPAGNTTQSPFYAAGSNTIFTIDTVAPTAPVIDPLITSDTTPEITGSVLLLNGVTAADRESLVVVVNDVTYAEGSGLILTGLNGSSDPTSTNYQRYTWKVQLPELAANTTYPVTATVTDKAGNATSDTSTNELTIDTDPPRLVAFTSSTTDGSYKAGATINITAIASESLRANSTIEVTLNTGTPGDSVTLTALADGTTLTGSYLVGAGDTSDDLDVTSFTVINAQDLAGNSLLPTLSPDASSLAGTKAIVIDTTVPDAPVINSIIDNAGLPETVSTGGATDDPTPGFDITAERSGYVSLYLMNPAGDTYLGSATVAAATGSNGATGSVTITPTTLPDGIHSFYATVRDPAGNISGASAPFVLTIDGTPPIIPTVTTVGTIAGSNPVLTGTASLSMTDVLTVTVTGTTFNQTFTYDILNPPVQGWSFSGDSWTLSLANLAPPLTMPTGTYTVAARVNDAFGREALATTVSVLADSSPPTIAAFNAGSPNGTYREGQTITITATANEAVLAGSQITATLDTGDTVLLTAGATGTLFSGTYTVSPGDVSADLNVVSYLPGDTATAGANKPQDLYGNTMVVGASTGFTSLAATAALVVNGTSSVSFAQAAVAVTEGNAGSTTMTFTVTLDRAISVATSVNWVFVSDGPTPATATDFVGGLPTGGTVTIAANTISQTFTLNVAGDTLREANETFQVRLTNPSANLTIGATAIATGTITNNDGSTNSTGAGAANTNRTVTASDYVVGGTANNNFNASTSAGSVVLDGGAGNDTLTGGSAADQLLGGAGTDTLAGGGGNDVITGGINFDQMTGGAGNDTFYFVAGDAAANSSTTTSRDFITDFTKALDFIDYGAPLQVGGVATPATATQASINQLTGVATFAANSGTTLADALADVAVSFGADGVQTAGEFALFRVNGAGNFWMMISDGVAGVGANDVAVQLGGITTVGSININPYGQLSILT